jgi:hypothetical protein
MILKTAYITVIGFRIICSPDLTPLGVSVFGYLKNEVYKRQMNILNELIEEITNCCCNIKEQMLQNTE